MSHPEPEVSVVVVTWNGCHLLKLSLPAILDQTNVHHEVILVDNGSIDDTVAWTRSTYPSVRVIELDRNEGFAAGNNHGFSIARAPLIATINNDAVPDKAWLAHLVDAARTHEESGMFASRMVYAHGPPVINSAGISIDPLGIAWDRMSGEPDASGGDCEVFGASAGAALYRKELIDETGGFDERFFAYLEDADLAWRARWLGWKAQYISAARVRHLHSSTWHEDSPMKTFHLGRNKVWLIAKNYPRAALLAILPLLVGYDIASLPVTVCRQRKLTAVWGRLVGIMGIPMLRSDANSTPGHSHASRNTCRTANWSDIRAAMEPIASPIRILRRHQRLRRTLDAHGPSSSPHP